MHELKRYHPFVLTVFIFMFLAWNTLSSHPLIHVMILFVSWMYLLEFPDISIPKLIGGNLLLVLVTMITNPIFQHRGIYPLFTIWDTPITIESLAFGADLGCMLCGILNLFRLYSHMIHADQILYMMTKVSPNAAILCSLSITQLSRLQKQYQDMCFARGLIIQDKGFFGRIKENVLMVSCLITWLMETSVETSLSMRSRGFALRKRSSYVAYHLERRDLILLLFEILAMMLSIYALSGLRFWWYPTFYADVQLFQAGLFCILFFLYSAVPWMVTRKERVLWDNIESTSIN